MGQAQDQPPWDPDEDAPVLAANADAIHLPGPRLLPGMEAPVLEAGKPLCAKVDGFSLHAARTVTETAGRTRRRRAKSPGPRPERRIPGVNRNS